MAAPRGVATVATVVKWVVRVAQPARHRARRRAVLGWVVVLPGAPWMPIARTILAEPIAIR